MKPVLFVTGHAPPDRVGAFAALHEREEIEVALSRGPLQARRSASSWRISRSRTAAFVSASPRGWPRAGTTARSCAPPEAVWRCEPPGREHGVGGCR